MDVAYGDSPIVIPAEVQPTEITTYLWPGFLGEFDHTTLAFEAWELVEPGRWIPRPDIVVPPFTCLGHDTATGWRWCSDDGSRWLALRANLWRRIR